MDDKPVSANHKVQHRYPHEIRYCPLCAEAMRERMVLPDNKPARVCSGCGFIYFLGPKLVAGCLIESERRVLLIRRGIEPSLGLWTFPGGYVDLGETPPDAALRETEEEVRMKVELGSLLGIYADPDRPIAAIAVYLAEPGPEPPAITAEATEISYFATDEIPWAELAFRTTRDALTDWVEHLKRR